MSDIIPTGWSIAGIGDFNGDGFSDLLLRDAAGTVTDWLGTGTGFTPNDDLSTPLPGWQVAGIGTFNADGRDDILWRHDGGLVTDWLGLAEGTFTGNDSLMTQMDTAWHVVATGDFNGDGRADILWRYDNGLLTDWLSNPDGTFSGNDSFVFQMDVGWHVAGSGDFNGDGRADILWRNDNGLVIDWLGQADGSFIGNDNLATPMDSGWQIAGTGDFNGDGRSDILWRHETGLVTDWLGLADGTFVGNDSATFQAVGDWQIAGLGDFNGDHRDDIIWRNDTGSLDIQYSADDGTFIKTTEQLWEEALANVSAFFDELETQMDLASQSPSADQGSYYDDYSDWAPMDDPFYLDMFGWMPSVQNDPSVHFFDYLTRDVDPEFLAVSLGTSGFSAAFSHDHQNQGSMNAVLGFDNTYLFTINGIAMQGIWHPTPPPQTPVPEGAITITGHSNAGYWTFDPVGFGDMSYSYANGGNFVEATQDWGHAQYVADPLTGALILSATGAALIWPSGINMAAIFSSGQNAGLSQALASDPILFAQNGYWDFQRAGGTRHPEFIDASTVAIGIYNAAAGVPLSTILSIENDYAAQHSSYPPGTVMDSTYTSLPQRNVQNTIIGYQIADHIRQKNGI